MHWRYCSLALSHPYEFLRDLNDPREMISYWVAPRQPYNYASDGTPCGTETGIFWYNRSIPWLLIPWLFMSPGHQQLHMLLTVQDNMSTMALLINTFNELITFELPSHECQEITEKGNYFKLIWNISFFWNSEKTFWHTLITLSYVTSSLLSAATLS